MPLRRGRTPSEPAAQRRRREFSKATAQVGIADGAWARVRVTKLGGAPTSIDCTLYYGSFTAAKESRYGSRGVALWQQSSRVTAAKESRYGSRGVALRQQRSRVTAAK